MAIHDDRSARSEFTHPLLAPLPNLTGATVLVTGGTGSFGQAFVRRMLAWQSGPAKLIVFSRDEQKHFAMQGELSDHRLRFFVGDVRDRDRLGRALGGVDIVIHAAAMKHVSIAEYNPIEAIRTNVDGAANLIDAALDRGVSHVVALSTDKAVSPVNLYGATKLCMEKLLVAGNSYAGAGGTRFDIVRYGNVVGSKGSVVPLFMAQKAAGKLQLTEPSMTRFWITMDRAVDLVLLALSSGRGGEVFVPKLPACRVDVLADAIAPDVPRELVGMRAGEKMHEAMITVDEARQVLEYDTYFVIEPTLAPWGLQRRTDTKPVAVDFSYSSSIARQMHKSEVVQLLLELGYPVQSS